MPCVSIRLPLYNGENYLVQAIDSILNRNHPASTAVRLALPIGAVVISGRRAWRYQPVDEVGFG